MGRIPKSNGRVRLLGVPTVVDRWLQQAVSQAIGLKFEEDFKEHSYGFRPNRNAQQAVQQAQKNINEGYAHIVDIDLKSFFDEVDHCLLLQLLYRKVKCPVTLDLIRRWMRVPILINGKLTKRRKGVPQGSPLSPLLSNIMLHELDKELEKQGLKYVRYADDFSIYTKSKSEARKIGNNIYLFLKNKLKLPINREKSGIRKPVQFEILGYKFVPTYEKGTKGKYQLVASEKSWKKLKESLKAITQGRALRKCPVDIFSEEPGCRACSSISFDVRITKLNEACRGWVNYFCLGSLTGKLKDIDSWVQGQALRKCPVDIFSEGASLQGEGLRYCIWKHWKKPDRRRINLIRLGVEPVKAYQWSRTRMGGWAVAQSPMLLTTITLQRLAKRGYISMLDYYFKVAPQLNEPLYARPARTVV